MSVATTKTGQSFAPVTAGVPCVVNDMKIFSVSQIAVFVDGDETDVAVLNVDYTATIAGGFTGCTVTPLAPLAGRASSIFVARRTPLTSDFDLSPFGKLNEARITEQLDRDLMRDQENAALLARAIRVARGETVPALPPAADRENTVLGFDADGNLVLKVLTGGEAAVELATVAEARAGVNTTKLMTPALTREANWFRRKHLFDYTAGIDPATITDWSLPLRAAAATGQSVELPDTPLPYSGGALTEFQRVGGGFIAQGYDCVLQPTFGNDDAVRLGNDIDGYVGHRFENIRVWPLVPHAAGYSAWNFRRATQMVLDRVGVGSQEDYGNAGNTHRCWHGLSFNRFAEIVLRGQAQVFAAADGLRMHGGDGLFGAELIVQDRYRFLHCDTAIRVGGGSGGVYLNSFDASLCRVSYQIDRSLANVPNREIFVNMEAIADVSSDYQVNIEGSAVFLVKINGIWLSGQLNAAGASMRIAPAVDAVRPSVFVTGGRIRNATGDAMQIHDCEMALSNVEFELIGTGAGGGRAIRALNSGVDLRVHGCEFNTIGNGTLGEVLQAVTGVTGIFRDNVMRNIVNPGAAVSNASSLLMIDRNVGWVTERDFVASGITDAAGDLVVNHGMSITPQVVIANQANAGAVLAASPHSFGPTSFKVRFWIANTGAAYAAQPVTAHIRAAQAS